MTDTIRPDAIELSSTTTATVPIDISGWLSD
jgi:hypothetical protein